MGSSNLKKKLESINFDCENLSLCLTPFLAIGHYATGAKYE